jgi:hypothetical protein
MDNHGRLCLSPAFTLVSCSAYSSTLKTEAIYSSETLVDFQRTTRRYIPEDRTFQCVLRWILNRAWSCGLDSAGSGYSPVGGSYGKSSESNFLGSWETISVSKTLPHGVDVMFHVHGTFLLSHHTVHGLLTSPQRSLRLQFVLLCSGSQNIVSAIIRPLRFCNTTQFLYWVGLKSPVVLNRHQLLN